MSARRFLFACLAVVTLGGTALLGAAAGGAAVYVAAREQLALQPTANAPAAQPVSDQTVNVDINTAVTTAVSQVSPAVVTVVNTLGQGAQASGSGVIISA